MEVSDHYLKYNWCALIYIDTEISMANDGAGDFQ